MRRQNAPRKALTLIELVVVITILSLLGGLVVAIVPNLMKRTHLAKCADTISELDKIWLRSYVQNVRYPDVYDSLLASGGTAVDARLTSGLAQQISAAPLSAEEAASLQTIGITRVVDLSSTTAAQSVTYDAAPLGVAARVLAAGGNVALLDLSAHVAAGNPLNLKRHLIRAKDGSMVDNSVNVRYLVFGVGPNCSGVGTGKLIHEAPVHFGADDTLNPTTTYQRYLVVFSLVKSSLGVTAYFECAAGNDATGPSSVEAHIRQFHEASSKDE